MTVMNNMRRLTFAAVAAVAAGEAIQYGGAMAPQDSCPELPDLCTGAVLMQGTATTLTYVCTKTPEAGTTVHHTVTVTTTVPAPSNTVLVPPKNAPHEPELTETAEPTTTTTIYSTATQFKTLTVTRKTSSSSSSASATSSSKPNHPPLKHTTVSLQPSMPAGRPLSSWLSWANVTATSQSSKPSVDPMPWPNVTFISTTSSLPVHTPPIPLPEQNFTPISARSSIPVHLPPTPFPSVNLTGTSTFLPSVTYPTPSMSWFTPGLDESDAVASTHTPSDPTTQVFSMNATATSTSIWTPPPVFKSDLPLMPTVQPTPSSSTLMFTLAPEEISTFFSIYDPSATSSDTNEKSALPASANKTSTGGYGFPTPVQVRDVSANATVSTKPTKAGSAGHKSVSVAALFCGLVVAGYFA